MLHVFKIICFFLISVKIYSQPFVYSKNYFRWPVNNKPSIVANFGELRPGHWHMGLDVRTDQKTNQPVFAAADGYIARVSVHPSGFGQAIYINHPNGLTTLYGHLNKFFPLLDSFVIRQQYERESWEVDLDLQKNQFPVHKGQLIALSGSTGASAGPHVHFEIRNTATERCINPLFFNFPIPDAVPPVFSRLAVYDRSTSIYNQKTITIPVKKIKNQFVLNNDLVKTGSTKLGFGITAIDRVSSATNQVGIYSAKIFLDDVLMGSFALDSMDYNETDYINAHIDYRYRYNSNLFVQLLFRLPGDEGLAYNRESGDGTIMLADTNLHRVRIEIRDANQNRSELKFRVQYDEHLPASMSTRSTAVFSPATANVFEERGFEAYLPEVALYDSVQTIFYRLDQPADNSISPAFHLCDPSTPVHGSIDVRIVPTAPIDDVLKDKVYIRRTAGRGASIRKATWQQNWLAANFSDFGTYQAFVDNISPTVNAPGRGDTIDLSASKSIVFYPRDNTSVKIFRVEIDGQWTRFTNDKGSAWIYNFDARVPYGIHQLNVHIEDFVGNVTDKNWIFKRSPYSPPKKKAVKKLGRPKSKPPLKKKITTKKK